MISYEDNTIEFRRICKEVRNLRALPTNDELLQLYGLYKQATIGNNETSEPWSINIKAKAKWTAWKSYEGTDKETARSDYITLVNNLKERIGVTQ